METPVAMTVNAERPVAEKAAHPPHRSVTAKLLYTLLFNLALPAMLIVWARRAEGLGVGRAVQAPVAGAALTVIGAGLIGLGWWALWRHGGGLPMNAFPPPRHVARGIYHLFAHPIYDGAVVAVAGVALVAGSAGGLWLVTPLFGLAAAALVLGYEQRDLEDRFGPLSAGLPAPAASPGRARLRDRASYLLHAAGPWATWVLANGLWAGSPPGATVLAPLSILVLAPLCTRSRTNLAFGWHLARRALVAEVLLAILFGPLAPSLMLARMGLALALGLASGRLWEAARAAAERICNSWREWRFGPIRIIDHGAYAGIATAGGVWIVGGLVGPGGQAVIAIATLGGLLGAALWAQVIEGSAQLSRPFGFYGGLLGIVLSASVAPWFGVSPWLLLAAFAAAAPWIQSVGRLRCLVQGCCHGHPAPAHLGIRHRHPRSRVVRLSMLGGIPVHPTPLYSILWNGVVAIVLSRAWAAALPLHAIGGLYLFLGGAGRFVEEAYRGEPQTPVFFRLRLYQWVAMASMIAGAACMSFGSSGPAPAPSWTLAGVPWALALGLVVAAALGVDFPQSERRFSRLA